jgi:hypothetical protein
MLPATVILLIACCVALLHTCISYHHIHTPCGAMFYAVVGSLYIEPLRGSVMAWCYFPRMESGEDTAEAVSEPRRGSM